MNLVLVPILLSIACSAPRPVTHSEPPNRTVKGSPMPAPSSVEKDFAALCDAAALALESPDEASRWKTFDNALKRGEKLVTPEAKVAYQASRGTRGQGVRYEGVVEAAKTGGTRWKCPALQSLLVGPAGTLHGNPLSLKPQPSKANSCWVEKICQDDQECWWGPRPCGPAGCAEMRQARSCEQGGSEVCEEHESCIVTEPIPNLGSTYPYPQCRPTPCAADSQCRSKNLHCSKGSCRYKTCKKSEDCDGYCVSGTCTVTPGRCVSRAELRVP